MKTTKLFVSLYLVCSILILSGCVSGSAEDTAVIIDDQNRVSFASKKYNPDLASKDEFEKARKREKEQVKKERKRLGLSPSPGSPQESSILNNPNIRYGTDAPTDYEEYKRWRAASGAENSAEYQRFKLWQEFENYRKWKEGQEENADQ